VVQRGNMDSSRSQLVDSKGSKGSQGRLSPVLQGPVMSSFPLLTFPPQILAVLLLCIEHYVRNWRWDLQYRIPSLKLLTDPYTGTAVQYGTVTKMYEGRLTAVTKNPKSRVAWPNGLYFSPYSTEWIFLVAPFSLWLCGDPDSFHVCFHLPPFSQCVWRKKDTVGKIKFLFTEVLHITSMHTSFPRAQMTTVNCDGDWEMWSSCQLRRKKL